MPTKDEVFEKVQEALVEALGVDDDEVTPEATLVGDLGAESIDFLDIVFRLEKAFDIKIPRGELFPEDVWTNAEYVQDGKVTEVGLEELRRRMPFANLDEFCEESRRSGIRQPADRRRHVPVCRRQSRRDRLRSRVRTDWKGVCGLARNGSLPTEVPRRSDLCILAEQPPMRWYWIDRFIEFESGRRAKAVKNITLAEDHLHDHFPFFPLMPNSLIIEGVAQTGGLLVCESTGFQEKVGPRQVVKGQVLQRRQAGRHAGLHRHRGRHPQGRRHGHGNEPQE